MGGSDDAALGGGEAVLIPKVPIKVSQADRFAGAFSATSAAAGGASKPGTRGSTLGVLISLNGSLSEDVRGAGAGSTGSVALGATTGDDFETVSGVWVGSSADSSPHMLTRRRVDFGSSGFVSATAERSTAGGGNGRELRGSAEGSDEVVGVFSTSGGSAGPGMPNWLSSNFQLSDILMRRFSLWWGDQVLALLSLYPLPGIF